MQCLSKIPTIINPDVPDRPWQTGACHVFYLKGRRHLLMVYYLSIYIEKKQFYSIKAIIIIMKPIYTAYAVPPRAYK